MTEETCSTWSLSNEAVLRLLVSADCCILVVVVVASNRKNIN